MTFLGGQLHDKFTNYLDLPNSTHTVEIFSDLLFCLLLNNSSLFSSYTGVVNYPIMNIIFCVSEIKINFS